MTPAAVSPAPLPIGEAGGDAHPKVTVLAPPQGRPRRVAVTPSNWKSLVLQAVRHLQQEKYITPEQVSQLEDIVKLTAAKDIVTRLMGEGVRAMPLAESFATVLGMPNYVQSAEAPLAKADNYMLTKAGALHVVNPFDITGLNVISKSLGTTKVTSWGVIAVNLLNDANTTIDTTRAIDQKKGGEFLTAQVLAAFHAGASDIHIHPREHGVHVRFRLDGTVRQMTEISHIDYPDICGSIMTNCGLNAGEYIRPIDGRFIVTSGITRIPCRVAGINASVNADKTPKWTIRLLKSKVDLLDLDKLGFSKDAKNPQLRNINEAMRKPYGMMVITGPTGSGKSTTLFAVMRWMMARHPGGMYYTLEDPVEAELPGAVQIQCFPDEEQGPTFSTGLRNLLRQDPDTILVGEIRDQETANLGVKAAITGHRVLTTLHANTSCGAATRLRDMGVEPSLMADALAMLSAQRIIPRVCAKCAHVVTWGQATKDPESLADFAGADETAREMLVDRYREAPSRYRKLECYPSDDTKILICNHRGCTSCDGRGIKGRVLIAEILPISSKLKQLISQPRITESEILEAALSEGFRPMWEHAFQAIAAGQLSLDRAEEGLGPLPMETNTEPLHRIESISGSTSQ